MVEIIWEVGGSIRRLTGEVSAVDLDSSAQHIQDDARFSTSKYVIHDFTECTRIVLDDSTRDKIVVRAAVATMSRKGFASAFVGTLPELKSIVAYFKSVQVYDGAFALFTSMAEARAFVSKVNSAAD